MWTARSRAIGVVAMCLLVALVFLRSEDRLVTAGDKDGWPGLHKKGVPLRTLNLNDTKTKVDFFYHRPTNDTKKPGLEGRVLRESEKTVTVGVSVWKQDVAFHAYDKKRKTLEVYLLPEHLKDPKEVRIQIVPLTKFDVPSDINTVRVIYLP